MKIIFSFLIFISWQSWAGTVTVNGQTFECNGSVSIINNNVTCDGVAVSISPSQGGPCGGAKTRRHANGGGQVDLKAKVPAEAYVAGTICGPSQLSKTTKINKGAQVNGGVLFEENVTVDEGATVNGDGWIVNSNVGKNAVLNGNLYLRKTTVADGATINGNIYLMAVKVAGKVNCTGDGVIHSTSPEEVAQ